MLLNIIYLLAGFIILVYGANLLVDGGAALAHRLKVPNIVIGLTVVAFGTFSRWASAAPPSTSKLAPYTKIINPANK